MFNKLKQFKDLRSQAKTMQKALADERVNEEKNGVKVTLNGNLEIEEIKLNSELSQEASEKAVKDCINDAIKKAQKLMAKKMQEMGGFPGLG
ncbi:MAG: YbaB/EbfC family nucleoid-associated protein [Candidatus Pacebacteria bacterium]|nr:YbaB/EbfC family nucleoid-associated protein [Candidatus Paceibacterota bacterium]